jgi:hypothetical protein
MPWIFLLLTAGFWTWASIKPQQEQRLNREAGNFARKEDWAGLVTFLSTHEKSEFAPANPLPPAVYEYSSWERITAVLSQLTSSTPTWIRSLYLSRLETLLSMGDYRSHMAFRLNGYDPDKILTALENLAEGPAFARQHAKELRQVLTGDFPGRHSIDPNTGKPVPENGIKSTDPHLDKLLQKAGGPPP